MALLSVAPSTIVARLATGNLGDIAPGPIRSLLFDGAALTTATVAGADKVLIQDTDDSDILKTVTAQAIADLAVGDVVGPGSSTDNALARFNLATGKLIQNSLGILTDAGALSGLTTINMSGNLTVGGTVDGRDVAADGIVLDGIEPGADITDEANVITALDGATIPLITPLPADKVLLQDVSDTDALGYATITDVLSLASGGGGAASNAIYNGNFNIWQRGTTFTAPAADEYTADRWAWRKVGAGVVNILRSTDVPNGLSDFSIHVDVTTADASLAATDIYGLEYRVEGLDSAKFGLGTAAAETITISFWVKATKTGIHSVALQNSAVNRSYAAEYTVDVTNTWEKKSITIILDTAGTWLRTNGIGLAVFFALAAGSNFTGTPGAWDTADDKASTNQVNSMDNAANDFRLSQVQLEVSAAVTPFSPRPFTDELLLCRRYYQKTFLYDTAPATGTGREGCLFFRVPWGGGTQVMSVGRQLIPAMRDDPAERTYYNPVNANANWYNNSIAADSGAAVSHLDSEQVGITGVTLLIGDLEADLVQVHATYGAEL
jgi:hypothetical protein